MTKVNPANGPLVGGTSVTITATGFTGATAVSFGSVPDLTVTSPDGTSSAVMADQFTYLDAPTVAGVSPAAGSVSGGTTGTITGTGFADTATVRFGKSKGVAVTVVSPTTITITSPASTSEAAGTVNVIVTTSGGTSVTSASDGFTYTTP